MGLEVQEVFSESVCVEHLGDQMTQSSSNRSSVLLSSLQCTCPSCSPAEEVLEDGDAALVDKAVMSGEWT